MSKKFVAGVRSYLRAPDTHDERMEMNDAALKHIGLTRADVMNLCLLSEPVRTKPVSDRAPLLVRFAPQPTAQVARATFLDHPRPAENESETGRLTRPRQAA